MRKLIRISGILMALAVILPLSAFAHENNSGKDDSIKASVNASVKTERPFKSPMIRNWFVSALFESGTVTAVGTDSFTMQNKDNVAITVSTAGAKLIRLPATVITLSNIAVGDKVWVEGSLINSQINALVVYDMSANVQPAAKKGTVTAIIGNAITVATKHSGTVTVNTDATTQIKQNGQLATLADVKVGSKIGVVGLWDKVLNILTAIKIHIKA